MDTRAKHYQELREQMIDLKKALQGVANLGDDFTGKGADNIKSFYKELAGNVDMFISFIDKQKAFHEGVSGTLDDTNFGGDTFVEEHFLDNAVHMGIKNAKSIVKDQKKALKTIFQDIDDLISLEVFDSKTFDEKIADAEDERKKTVKDLIELDQNLKDEYALSETEEKATMALYAEMMNATNDGKSILPMNFDKKAYQNSEIYKAKSDIEKQTSEYLKIKKDQEEARKIAKEQEALANRPWYEKALDYGGNIVNELTGVNDAKRAATGVDPITGEELTAGQRVAAGGMAAAGYIPIVGWAGRIFKGGKAVYKTTQATSAAVRAVDIYKTSQKSFDALKTSQKGLYGLTATNGFSEAITGRDMFGNKISKEQQEASMNAALAMLLPFGSKGFQGKMGVKGAGKSTDIPSVRNKEFNKWFDKLSVDEFEKAWNVPALRSKIEDRIRQPGGYHEWHLVARTPQFKKWDVSMDRIKELRTLTKDVEFVNPPGRHGGRGSTKAHNEILKIIDNAPDYESFVRELNEWASKRMKNGVQDLPEGLRR
ncbi:ribonuclease YeeF family protein [Bacillus altitudinis]|uniref:ribonuclease YeeF family protein n=3 Tax=Bacillus TaxID=1386 RepID=UPI001EE9BFE2|nr:T7SS effector LXG polymorphic toxin [Bacillus altitudinis]UUH74787.1 T7SS effector LXG polymorphic toxin [Bacillus altitudinis]